MFEGGKPDPELADQLESVQREVKQLEIESEHQRQSKGLQVCEQNLRETPCYPHGVAAS